MIIDANDKKLSQMLRKRCMFEKQFNHGEMIESVTSGEGIILPASLERRYGMLRQSQR